MSCGLLVQRLLLGADECERVFVGTVGTDSLHGSIGFPLSLVVYGTLTSLQSDGDAVGPDTLSVTSVYPDLSSSVSLELVYRVHHGDRVRIVPDRYGPSLQSTVCIYGEVYFICIFVSVGYRYLVEHILTGEELFDLHTLVVRHGCEGIFTLYFYNSSVLLELQHSALEIEIVSVLIQALLYYIELYRLIGYCNAASAVRGYSLDIPRLQPDLAFLTYSELDIAYRSVSLGSGHLMKHIGLSCHETAQSIRAVIVIPESGYSLGAALLSHGKYRARKCLTVLIHLSDDHRVHIIIHYYKVCQ